LDYHTFNGIRGPNGIPVTTLRYDARMAIIRAETIFRKALKRSSACWSATVCAGGARRAACGSASRADRTTAASAKLGLVMSGAVVLNLVIAGASGVLIPIALHEIGRNPAHGSSVLVTFMTDAMGFFLFLGLASWFLV
jgi:Mg/Co/Ni transporter MgtE